MPNKPQDYALVIGFNDYPHYGANGRPLRGAIHDAEAFGRWLTDKTVGGGLPDENCIVLKSSLLTADPPQPRKQQIDDALNTIWKRSGKTGARRFYFYFSGHGQTQSVDELALCLPHWAPDREAAAISYAEYRRFILECMKFSEVVFLMDCCRSRKIGARGQVSENTCPKPHEAAGGTLVFAGQATEFQEQAFEGENPQPIGDEEPVVHGHFTEALLAALRGGAARNGGGVPASELWTYLLKVVPRIAMRHGHIQKPRIDPFNIAPGDPHEPVFGAAPKITQADIVIAFRLGRSGNIRLEGPDLAIVRQGAASTGPWMETLPVGTYLLTDLSSSETMPLHLAAGEEERYVEF